MSLSKTSKSATGLGQKAALLVLAVPVLVLFYVAFWGLTPQLVKAVYLGIAILCCGLIAVGVFLFYLKRRNARQK